MPQRLNTFLQTFYSIKIEILTFMLALLVPIYGSLMFIGLLIVTDTITGVLKTVKTAGWSHVQSRALSNGVLPKLTMYPLILLIASGCEQAFSGIPFIKGAVFLLMCIELKSLIENFNVILKINLFTYIKTLILKGRKEMVIEILSEDEKNS